MGEIDYINPRLVGLTSGGSISVTSSKECEGLGNRLGEQPSRIDTSQTQEESNYFKSAQWSPDGTTILTSSVDNTLRSFILPVDLLNATSAPHNLLPYNLYRLPEPTYSIAIHPSYDLQNPASTLFIASLRALPIRLISPFSPSIIASYPLVSLTTEKFIAPHSLLFSPNNTNHFFAGSESLVSSFDINRNGDGPFSRAPTILSRRNKNAGGEMGMKGIVSALGISSEGLLAAGTFSRWVGLYDGYGRGGTMGVFEVRGLESPEDETYWGTGITQVIWSSCGRYLCVVERGSDGVGVWDIRGSGKRLSWLRGRNARTNQRLAADLIRGEIWAGGVDGKVRVWESLGMHEGDIDTTWEFQAHDDAVSAAGLHPSGIVLATCSGQRHFPLEAKSLEISESDSDDEISSGNSLSAGSPCPQEEPVGFRRESGFDNSLAIWAL